MVDSNGPASRSERALLALALIGVPALVIYEWAVWHPGWSRVDEVTVLLWMQRWRDGIDIDLRAGSGFLTRALYRLCMLAFGSGLFSLHLPHILSLGAECFFLQRCGSRLFGPRAAVWALLCALLGSFTLMNGRSLLAYPLVPAEALGMAFLYFEAPGPWGRFFLGFTAGTLLLDYDLWFLGAPAAMAFAFWGDKKNSSRLALSCGFCMAATAVAWISRDSFATYAAIRSAKNMPSDPGAALSGLGAHLRDFFLGGNVFPNVGTAGNPVFPAWAWGGLAVGLVLAWRQALWLLLWASFGMLPLAFRSPGLEPQRALLAWPVLCLFAGAGMAWLAARSPKALPLLLALPLAGYAWELNAHSKSMKGAWAEIYGNSSAQLAAIERLKSIPGPLLDHFDFHSTSPARYLLPQVRDASQSPVALVPWYALPALRLETGRLETVHDGASGKDCYLFFPTGSSIKRMADRDRRLQELWDRLSVRDRFARSADLKRQLDQPGSADPWLRSQLWTEYLEALHYTGRLTDGDIEALLAEKNLPTAEPFRETALREGRRRPALGLRLMERAAAIDSRLPFTPELRAPLEYFLARQKAGLQP